MRFQPGCYYQHEGGLVIHTLCRASTWVHGFTLVAEDYWGTLIAVGTDSDEHAEEYKEVDELVWLEQMLPSAELEAHKDKLAFLKEAAEDALLQ